MSTMSTETQDYPVRAGVFSTAEQARQAVTQLEQAGFTAEEISIVCSTHAIQSAFPEIAITDPSGSHSSDALNKAGLGALGLGAVALGTALVTSGGTALVVIGAFGAIAVAGTFVALMATRGLEPEVADYYDQAIESGKILVAVEVPGESEEAHRRRELADGVIAAAGAEPLPLAH